MRSGEFETMDCDRRRPTLGENLLENGSWDDEMKAMLAVEMWAQPPTFLRLLLPNFSK